MKIPSDVKAQQKEQGDKAADAAKAWFKSEIEAAKAS
jgi:hypothetical protein